MVKCVPYKLIFKTCLIFILVTMIIIARKYWVFQQKQALRQHLWAIVEQPLETRVGEKDMTEKETERYYFT